MKRQAERDSSPARAIAKRIRERDRERDAAAPLALLLAESRNYHKRQARSRSREKARLREEPHHRQHHDPALLGRPALRTTPALPKAKPSAELLAGRASGGLEYKTLLISNFTSQLTDEQVEDGLFHEFKKFGDVSVKLSHTPELGRVAYVNFRHPENAREARRAKTKLVMCDRALKIEPVYVRRRSSTPPEVGYLPLSPGGGASSSVREARARHVEALGLSRERERILEYYSALDERGRAFAYQLPEDDLKPEDDQRATRNLFIGNLDHAVSEPELRQGFDKYGIIEEVVIKRPARGQGGAYAFLKFQNLDMAHRAKVAMQGRMIGGNPIKIGYGKANPTTRLWVGGLGPSTSLAALAREFDRFGSIRTIDYVKGDSFAYIQYESLDAAQAACAQMRGFPLGGPSRRLRVDFAKADELRSYGQQYPSALAVPAHYELLAEGYAPHCSLERELRTRARSPTHPLAAERDCAATFEPDWSPPKSLERRTALEALEWGRARSRSRERWVKERDAERALGKAWEERHKRRSLSADRLVEERGRSKVRAGGPVSPEDSPDRARGRLPDSTSEPQDRSPDGGQRSPDDPDPPASHRKEDGVPERNHNAAPDSQTDKRRRPGTLSEFAQPLGRVWHGALVLKNSCFPTDMHLLQGSSAFALALLQDQRAKPPASIGQLKIAQRLRLDQPKLDEVTRRIKLGGPEAYAVLLALQAPAERDVPPPEPGLQKRLLRNLVTYLRNKQAAGVISLPLGGARERAAGGMLYAFPPCDFSQQYLQDAVRTLGALEEEHMVVVMVKDSV
ncbi:putative RNA-binding protein 15B [Denticeps clupeoides]|uniref:Putative RNA-binding protein 15B n=1 Tax=Denticeps clupeoides TaxID=299321 RepID=A0AAY4B1V3_9TELE|nr:putative RNA-binding protein 15B [Denticeps clupeoides]